MLGVLFLVFVVLPIVELAVIIKVGAAIGVLNTIGLLLLMGALGSWLVKHEGLSVLRRVQLAMSEGRVPAAELLDGLLILVGGALMIAPGFLTDILGLSLMLPPVRAVVRRMLRGRIETRVASPGSSGPRRPDDPRGGGFIELP
ncbi:MAG: FxsA family protein [Acidobacteria bacterium]|nr:FxsA family protein [Acidobacteriota bacterium]